MALLCFGSAPEFDLIRCAFGIPMLEKLNLDSRICFRPQLQDLQEINFINFNFLTIYYYII